MRRRGERERSVDGVGNGTLAKAYPDFWEAKKWFIVVGVCMQQTQQWHPRLPGRGWLPRCLTSAISLHSQMMQDDLLLHQADLIFGVRL